MNAAAGADKESMQVTAPTSNGSRMSAGDVLDALEKAWKESALVRELTITDTRELYRELEKGEKHGPLKRRIDALIIAFTFFQWLAIMVVVTETYINGREARRAEYAYLRGAR